MRIKLLLLVLLTALPCVLRAQFYTAGDNPASTKWHSTETAHYKIIYPEGLDSLARVYGRSLEKYRPVIGSSAGYLPGEYTHGKLPVIMHGFNAASNGSVAWAPKHMDLFTSPQAYNPEPMTWTDMLTTHEQRHVAQMQTGISRAMRPFNYIIGEMFNGFVAGVYSHSFVLEGDAVIAETALSQSGRGRTADFLNYYLIAFDQGDIRSLPRWRFTSQRHYAPNEYASGYLFISGVRYLYDAPDLIERFYELISRKPYKFTGFPKTVKHTSGLSQRETFLEIADTLTRIWKAEIAARAPYTPYSPVSEESSIYTIYRYNEPVGGDIYSVRSGLADAAALVRTSPDGTEKKLRAFASSSSKLAALPGTQRLYWSEYGYDTRWSLKTNSIIRYYDASRHKTKTITRRDRLFSPAASPDGTYLSTTRYYDNGRTGLTVLDPETGEYIAETIAPDSLQIVESAWEGDRIYATGVSESGYGIYSIGFSDGEFVGGWTEELAPEHVMIGNFKSVGGALAFSCDRTGVRELYHFYPAGGTAEEAVPGEIAVAGKSGGRLVQKTSTKYGLDNFTYIGDTLYYSLKEHAGDYIVATPADSLFDRTVNYSDKHKWVVADALSAQEEAFYHPVQADPDTVQFTDPKRYWKGTHLFKIHSWAPVYFNIDNVMNMSYDEFYELASLGVAFLSQNELGTAISNFGYSAHKDPYDKSNWRHSGHLNFSYTGWYPVIELSLDVNDRAARKYSYSDLDFGSYSYVVMAGRSRKACYVSGKVDVYLPLTFTRGGWSAGVIPEVTYEITNDRLTESSMVRVLGSTPTTGGYVFSRKRTIPLQQMTASVRAYTMRPVATSGVYPRLGIGVQGGVSFRPCLQNYYSPMLFTYLYGYLPGFYRTHGISVSVLNQARMSKNALFGDDTVNSLPRGMRTNGDLSDYTAWYSDASARLSTTYSMPIFVGDVSFGGYFLYLKRLVLTPHFDYTFYDWSALGRNAGFKGGLWSAGASLTFATESLFWIKFPMEIGITYSYNGGSGFSAIDNIMRYNTGSSIGRHYIGPTFTMSFE